MTPEDSPPGSPIRGAASLPTILDVAARAGVSKSVVSRALSGAPGVAASTEARVRIAAAELGYVANANAQGMSARRTHTLGVLVRDAATPFYGHLLTAFQERAAVRGYRTVTATGAGSFQVVDERRALETLVSLRVEGLIVCSGLLPVDDILPFTRRIPTVVAGRPEDDASLSSVYCDEVGGGRALAEHVVSLGHRRVAVMTYDPDSSMTQAPRSRAMIERLGDLGAEVVVLRAEDFGAFPDHAHRVVDRVLAEVGLTALMMPSDGCAVEALEALRVRGLRAPDDLSLTGYDGLMPSVLGVLGITTWRQPIRRIGELSVDEVVERIDGPARSATHRRIDGSLVPGRTAASR